jgi:hypothetical protein
VFDAPDVDTAIPQDEREVSSVTATPMTGLEFIGLLLLGAAAGILFVFLVTDLPAWR